MSTPEQDRSAILDVHKKWWESNHGLRISMMTECFPTGHNYFMFNLQGKDANGDTWNEIGLTWIPGPGALALLGFAGLVGPRRRRA